MAFSQRFLDELQARTGLAAVVGRRVRLLRKGREFLGLCPFHNEKTPSFTVNEQKGFFHCFGCGAHGTVFDFVMQTEGVGFREAVQRLAAEVGLELPQETPEEAARERRRQTLHEVVEAAAAFFRRMLRAPEGETARAYLRRRGVDEATADAFGLGYAPGSRAALRTALARDGFDLDLMVEAGLLIAPESGTTAAYDRFRDRLMFPIADRGGRAVGFGGRILGEGEPKYLNSPETPLFRKGELLYGLPRAKPAALARKSLVVVEGYLDVISLARAGFDHAVAPLGTALTDEQIRELWRLVAEPVVCFDGDAAGARAAARAAARALPLLRPGFGLRFAVLPDGEDPDSLIARGGADAFARAVSEAVPLSAFLWRSTVRDDHAKTPEQRASLWKTLRDHVQTIADPDVRREFKETFYRSLWPDRRDGAAGPRRRLLAAAPLGTEALAAQAVERSRDAEKTMLAIILTHPGFFHDVEEELGSVVFADPALDRLRQELILLLSGEGTLDAADVRDALRRRGLGDALSGLLEDPVIRVHRTIGPQASGDDLGATWRRAVRALKTVALEAELVATPLADDASDEEIERRLKLKRARLDDGSDDPAW
ncbi:MAG: DNA primase [Rhodospirillales bacterium]